MDPSGHLLHKELLTGKPLLINFFSKHCGPCIREVPKLNEIKKRRSDINVLAITTDVGLEAANYSQEYGLNWPIASDAAPLQYEYLKVLAIPAFAILDSSGRLITTVQANELGGEDGHATVDGIAAWIDAQVGKAAN